MSLFPTETPSVSIPESTRIIQLMRSNNKRSLDTRKQTFLMNFRHFWRSCELTTQILADLGTDAKEWFDKSWAEQLALKDLDSTWEFLVPPFPFEIHEDGSVTLTEIVE